MADSDHSTRLSYLSRRKLLTGTATAPLFPIVSSSSQLSAGASDPILPLWQEWQRLHTRATGLCHRWQDMETYLMRKIGVPQVRIPSPDNPAAICAHSHAEIDRALATLFCPPEIGTALHADLTARQGRWDAEAASLGFDEIKQLEDEAWSQEAEASKAIFRARATSLVGIEIKIALIVELCSTGSDDPEFPWPQLRSTLADVKRLRRRFGSVQC
ncbi:MAG: hypothetical protein JWM91_605 [Rhodospirillales bacterium]|nr:hypothetical protein [Rhodospirillales bacterium]